MSLIINKKVIYLTNAVNK